MPSDTTIKERCSCGATFEASGFIAGVTAITWRKGHVCTNRRDIDDNIDKNGPPPQGKRPPSPYRPKEMRNASS